MVTQATRTEAQQHGVGIDGDTARARKATQHPSAGRSGPAARSRGELPVSHLAHVLGYRLRALVMIAGAATARLPRGPRKRHGRWLSDSDKPPHQR